MNKKYKLGGIVILIVLLIVVLIVGYKQLWWFTSGYSARQTTQSFFHDVNKGNDTAAYNNSSATFKDKNNYAQFQSNFAQLAGNKLKITYTSYSKKSDGNTYVTGNIQNTTTKDNIGFIFAVTPSGKINSMLLLSQPN